MRVEAHGAFAVAHRQVWVVVFCIGNEGQRIHEAYCLVVIFKGVGFLQRTVDEPPAQRLFAISRAGG